MRLPSENVSRVQRAGPRREPLPDRAAPQAPLKPRRYRARGTVLRIKTPLRDLERMIFKAASNRLFGKKNTGMVKRCTNWAANGAALQGAHTADCSAERSEQKKEGNCV